MEDIETIIARAQRIVDFQNTYRWLNELGFGPVTETTLQTLACIACQNSQDLPATIKSIAEAECAPPATMYNLTPRLREARVVIRTARHVAGRLGKPPYHHSLRDAPESVRQELLSQRPCQRRDPKTPN